MKPKSPLARTADAPAAASSAGAVGVALLVVLGGSGLANPHRGFVEGCVSCVRTGALFSLLPLVATLGMLRRMAFHAVRAVAADWPRARWA
ncbi:hypothetical protein [Cystobacter fuscus]|uniref:hypothetical protein n=1 Tax=Cystobacter fuscus TaxID=43 RepID=UPI0037BFB8F1